MSSRKRSILDGILYFINILFALGLLMAYLAYYIPPTLVSIFAFAATGYPVLLLVNFLFVIYWLIKLKRKIFLSIICIAIGYMHLPRMYQFGKAPITVGENESLKVMSYNVRLFNSYNWLKDETVEDRIVQLIADENPDVLMLQEFHQEKDNPLKKLGYRYKHSQLHSSGKDFGLVILSRFPITGSQVVEYQHDSIKKQFHYADILWKDKTIRFINVHLASIGLEDAEYDLLENVDQKNSDEMQEGLKTIITRMHHAFVNRAQQVETVEEYIEKSPHPVVLTGDFNDVPQSWAYHKIDLLLEDSFLDGGEGFGKTYIESPLPLRIDYIFHSPELQAFNFHKVPQKLSDHYPVVTQIRYR